MSEIKHKYFASIATKYSLAYNYIITFTTCSTYGVLKFNVFSVLYLYTSIYLSSDLHVLYSVHLRMAHVGRNM
jgi:hypothetical protein